MTDRLTKNINLTALCIALCCIITLAVKIPSPIGGYINPGDAFVLVLAFLLGPAWGAIAAGVGSALADMLSGLIIYAPATAIIKAAMVVAASLLYRRLKTKNPIVGLVLAGVAAELIMIAGYFFFAAVFLGLGLGAAAEIPFNVIQALFGIIAGVALFTGLNKIKFFNTLMERDL